MTCNDLTIKSNATPEKHWQYEAQRPLNPESNIGPRNLEIWGLASKFIRSDPHYIICSKIMHLARTIRSYSPSADRIG